MTKLHEILAVEGTKEKAANKLIKESLHTMGKESLFKGQVRKLEMFSDADQLSENVDHQELTTTVDENLDYLTKPISDWLDVVLTKETGNQSAKTDLVIDGKTLLTNVPATFLLGLEKKIIGIRSIYEAIPTLEPGVKWVEDIQNREGVFVSAHDSIQMKTRKEPEYKVVYEATEHHPAQVAQVERTVDIGRYITTLQSGKMTPLEKANRLSRIDKLLAAVKSARMKANNIEVGKVDACSVLLDYINKGS